MAHFTLDPSFSNITFFFPSVCCLLFLGGSYFLDGCFKRLHGFSSRCPRSNPGGFPLRPSAEDASGSEGLLGRPRGCHDGRADGSF